MSRYGYWGKGKMKSKENGYGATKRGKESQCKDTDTTKEETKQKERQQRKFVKVGRGARRWSKPVKLKQTTLDGRHRQEEEVKVDEFYGNIIKPRREGMMRVGFWNINKLPLSRWYDKSQYIVDTIVTKDFDIFGMAEMGLYWKAVNSHNQWNQRIDRSITNRSTLGYNKNEKERSDPYFPGGVGIVSTEEMVPCLQATGHDPTKLGRWVWQLFKGRQYQKTRTVMAYRPCQTRGPQTTYTQQYRYFNKVEPELEEGQNSNREGTPSRINPREQFYRDQANRHQRLK